MIYIFFEYVVGLQSCYNLQINENSTKVHFSTSQFSRNNDLARRRRFADAALVSVLAGEQDLEGQHDYFLSKNDERVRNEMMTNIIHWIGW